MKGNRDTHEIACFVHGVLVAFHALGLLYNVKRRNWLDVGAHSLGVAYDLKSVHHHYTEANESSVLHTPFDEEGRETAIPPSWSRFPKQGRVGQHSVGRPARRYVPIT